MRQIIAIMDTLANDIVGPLTIHQSDAAAIRFFGDVASHPDSQVGRHIEDYELVAIATIDDAGDLQVLPVNHDFRPRIILTGRQWAAVQQRAAELNKETGK